MPTGSSASSSPREPFKEWLNAKAAARVADAVARVHPRFERDAFLATLERELPPLELMDRALRIAAELETRLPRNYPKALGILLRALPPDRGGHFWDGQFVWLPVLRFVGRYGLAHPEVSLEALGEMTKRFSAEFDVRPYLVEHPDVAMRFVHRWARSDDPRQRRLASEGTRPRLPWGLRLQAFVRDPSPTLEVLEVLKDDPDEVVRRSVANHLNDVAKDHPERALAVARRWGRGATPERGKLLRHALRTLVKKGHPDALALVGADHAAEVAVSAFKVLSPEVRVGGELRFSFALASKERAPATVVSDYAVHHVKADGSLSPKVFKLAKRTLAPGSRIHVERAHPMKPITTRRYYPGRHRVELLVNGRSAGVRTFLLSGEVAMTARYVVSHHVQRWHEQLVPRTGDWLTLLHRITGVRRETSTAFWHALGELLSWPRTLDECRSKLESSGFAGVFVAAELGELVAGRFVVEDGRDYWDDYGEPPPGAGLGADRLRWARESIEPHGLWMYPRWFGVRALQWPPDLWWMQQLLVAIRPAFLVETGLFEGGSALFYVSIFELLGHGQVVAIEKNLRPDVKRTLESHPLAGRITVLEGDSADQEMVSVVSTIVDGPGAHVVALDSDHSTEHVARELEAWAPLVQGIGKIVVFDTSMSLVPSLRSSNPHLAVKAFLAAHPEWRLSAWGGASFVTACEDGVLERRGGAA